jgi:demethylmenaquinone methyltransferase/2-methoxy-6-polyprenyl-1,4-benzoquinol methylase
MDKKKVKPYNEEEEKKAQVGRMFDNIASKYDLLNRVLSAGIDQRWRKNSADRLKSIQPNNKLLDIATGTADLAIMLNRRLGADEIIGVDISNNMLDVGRKKITKLGLDNAIHLEWGDSENLQFQDNSFDGVTVAFGVRNFGDLRKGMEEIYRVIRPGGKAVILEFSKPRMFGFRQLYDFYFKTILPKIGRWTSRDSKAYSYLYESVQSFPDYEAFLEVLDSVGFKQCLYESQTLGICCIYEAVK